MLQGPVFGTIAVERPEDAGDAVVFLRCRGPDFIHGEMETDAENTRVGADGKFVFPGSLSLPNTTHCSLQIRHPRYLVVHLPLEKTFLHKLDPIPMQSWDAFFAAGSPYTLNPGTHRPWPESEVRRHLMDTVTWLRSFKASEQHRMARYVPAIHAIYRRATIELDRRYDGWPDMLKTIARIEEITAYPYPFKRFQEAVLSGDADTVEVFLEGGVLRETLHRRQNSMLYLAAAKGHLDVIAVLLAHDEPLNIAGCGAPLLGAIAQQQWLAAQALIRAGANVETGCSVHHRRVGDVLKDFAGREQLDLLTAFLEAGTPVDTRNSRGTTTLAEAVSGGHIQSVKLLLAAGANPREQTADQTGLLAVAQDKGYLDIERELQLAVGEATVAPAPPPGQAFISLPWRLGKAQPYRIHTSFGQVNGIAADPHQAGVLWLATWGGLVRIEPASGERQTWTRADGLPASPVKNLWFDDASQYLWLAASGGLARMPVDQPGRIETLGSSDLRPSFAGRFLQDTLSDAVWLMDSDGLARLDVEHSRALYYALPDTPFGITAAPDNNAFFISDNASLWRFNTATGERTLVLDATSLATFAPQGPPGPPQLRALALDPAQGYLWIGSHGDGVFRLAIDSGDITRPAMTEDQIAQCASNTITRQMHGQVSRAAGQTFIQLGHCFGRVDNDNRFEIFRRRIDAGPVADARGDLWYIADNRFHRIGSDGKQTSFPRGIDPLENAQARAIEQLDGQLLVSFQRGPKSVLDLKKRTWTTVDQPPKKIVPARGRHETIDPDSPELTWHVRSDALFLNSNGRLIQRWPAALRTGEILVSRDGDTTVWIASSEGLIEFPIGASLNELRAMAQPRQPPKASGRAPR